MYCAVRTLSIPIRIAAVTTPGTRGPDTVKVTFPYLARNRDYKIRTFHKQDAKLGSQYSEGGINRSAVAESVINAILRSDGPVWPLQDQLQSILSEIIGLLRADGSEGCI